MLCAFSSCWRTAVAGLLLVTVLGGCGPKAPFPLAPVQGTVSFKGKPLSHGRVVFVPHEGTPGPQAIGTIESDGSFQMRTGEHDGAAIGEHTVTVHCRREPTPEEARNLVITESLIPLLYASEDKSPLNIDVKDEDNALPIELE